MTPEEISQLAQERLMLMMMQASLDATALTIAEVAKEAGVTQLQGVPLTEFHQAKYQQKMEDKLRSGSDRNPTLVTAMKQLWERIQAIPPSH